jgi:hypothetical protein
MRSSGSMHHSHPADTFRVQQNDVASSRRIRPCESFCGHVDAPPTVCVAVAVSSTSLEPHLTALIEAVNWGSIDGMPADAGRRG